MLARRTFVRLGGAALAALSLPGCGDAEPPRARKPAVHTIVIKDMAFAAAPADLHVGDVIEWVNEDIFLHTATAQDGSFDIEVKSKARARLTLARAGAIAFYCRYHPGMKGVLVVTG